MSPGEVEGDLIDLGVLRERRVLVHLRCCKDGPVHQVLQAGLEMAVEVGQEQHLLVLLQDHVTVLLQDDPVHGERAGLVRAEDVHGAEVLDRVQALDDHLLAGHGQRALGEADRHDHGQHLRRQPHRHRQGEEEGSFPVPLGQPVDDEDQGDHDEDEVDHQPGEPAHAPVEAGRLLFPDDRAGHAAEEGVGPVATTTAVAAPLSTLVPR